MECSNVSHLDCTVDNLHITTKEGRLLVHDPVPHDGGIVVMGLCPLQADATRGDVNGSDILKLLWTIWSNTSNQWHPWNVVILFISH